MLVLVAVVEGCEEGEGGGEGGEGFGEEVLLFFLVEGGECVFAGVGVDVGGVIISGLFGGVGGGGGGFWSWSGGEGGVVG